MKLSLNKLFVIFSVLASISSASFAATDGKSYPGSLCRLTNPAESTPDKVIRSFDGGLYNDTDRGITVLCPIVHDDLSNGYYKAYLSFVRINAVDNNYENNQDINCSLVARDKKQGIRKIINAGKTTAASPDVQHLDLSPYKLKTLDNLNVELSCRLPAKKIISRYETRRSGITSYRVHEVSKRY